MNTVVLTLRDVPSAPIDASGLDFSAMTELDETAIARLVVLVGREVVAAGNLFTIRGSRAHTVRIEGPLSSVHGLASNLRAGRVVITGDAGHRVGAGMSGGSVHALGRVGDDAGVGMRGGELLVDGDAGDRLGGAEPGARRGMSGGEILVSGSAGTEAGVRARRGLIAIGGRTGADIARDIIAGTVVAFGRIGPRPGVGSKRGSVIALGGIDVPGSYRLACTYEPPFVRLLMTYLTRRFGANISDAIISGRYRRYCGDATAPGKGEILEWMRG